VVQDKEKFHDLLYFTSNQLKKPKHSSFLRGKSSFYISWQEASRRETVGFRLGSHCFFSNTPVKNDLAVLFLQ